MDYPRLSFLFLFAASGLLAGGFAVQFIQESVRQRRFIEAAYFGLIFASVIGAILMVACDAFANLGK